jgi:MFS transporter, DHA1 family, inner membrane transport protein
LNVTTLKTKLHQNKNHGANWQLLVLAVGTFCIGTTEFSPMGFLPHIATGLNISIPTAGLLISAYALGVVIGAPAMTLILARLPKRAALSILMGIFSVGNLLSAFSPNYEMLVLARILTSLSHGAFIGLGAVVAAQSVSRDLRARAVAAMFMGLTIANIGGVPAATWVGQQLGWRLAFVCMAGLGMLAIVALYAVLPRGEMGAAPNVRRELKVLTRPAVLLALATSALGSSAMFTLYTYIAPMLQNLTAASNEFVTLALMLVGVGFTVGNGVGGKLADWSLANAQVLILTALGLFMMLLPVLLTSHLGAAIGLLLWGAAAFAIVPPMQTRVMQAASEAPALASSINAGAFNLGNALGAAIGGGVLSLGLGYAAISIAGGVLAIASLGLVLIGRSLELEPVSRT